MNDIATLNLYHLIKKLSAEQAQLKPKRKTGPYECNWTFWTYEKDAPEVVRNARKAAIQVHANKLKITAALNLYHEARGSSHRHGLSEQDRYLYRYWEKQVKEMVGTAL